MSLQLTLTCDECGRSSTPVLFSRWAPYGVLELRGRTGFYVDGGVVSCPEHVDEDRQRDQQRGWQLSRDLEDEQAAALAREQAS